MEIAKLTSKGQITIPKAVRADLGVDTGDKLIFIKYDTGYLVCNGANFNVNAAAEESVEAVAPIAETRPVVRAERKVAPVYFDEEEEREEKPKKEKDKDKDKDKKKKKKKKK